MRSVFPAMWYLMLVLCGGGCVGGVRSAKSPVFWAEALVPGSPPEMVRRIKDGAVMRLVPHGRFRMGPTDAELDHVKFWGHPDAEDGFTLPHEVELSEDYYLDETEITNAQFDAFVIETGYKADAERTGGMRIVGTAGRMAVFDGSVTWRNIGIEQGDASLWKKLPVAGVSWRDCSAYAEWVMASLPTEAQYERALRDGLSETVFPWGSEYAPQGIFGNYADKTMLASGIGRKGNLTDFEKYEDGFARSAPVASFRRSRYGICDLSGNVAEWCGDWYEAAYVGGEDPVGPMSGKERVFRGGVLEFDSKNEFALLFSRPCPARLVC